MRLGHIIVSVLNIPSCVLPLMELTHFVNCIVNNASGHSGEVIPVPIPNTEVKLSYADDTAFAAGK